MPKKIRFALASLAVSGAATFAAIAPAHAETYSQAVDIAPYDVDSAAGYALVADRIEDAAGQVCGNVDPRNLALRASYNACRDAAVADGMAQLDSMSRRARVVITASR